MIQSNTFQGTENLPSLYSLYFNEQIIFGLIYMSWALQNTQYMLSMPILQKIFKGKTKRETSHCSN